MIYLTINAMLDILGKEIKVGDTVAYSDGYASCIFLELGKVTDIKISDKMERCMVTRLVKNSTPPFSYRPGVTSQFNAKGNIKQSTKLLVIDYLKL